MSMMINDQAVIEELLAQRRASGSDLRDEVWEGVYFMSPMADNEHQGLINELATALTTVIDWQGLGRTLPGANVSDRRESWIENYRVPDVLVFLNSTSSEDCGTHWFGGPDLAIEIVSSGDRTMDKLDFYAKIGTRELLIVDRDPWRLTLYRLSDDKKLTPVAVNGEEQDSAIAFRSLPVQIQLRTRPLAITLLHGDGSLIRTIALRDQKG